MHLTELLRWIWAPLSSLLASIDSGTIELPIIVSNSQRLEILLGPLVAYRRGPHSILYASVGSSHFQAQHSLLHVTVVWISVLTLQQCIYAIAAPNHDIASQRDEHSSTPSTISEQVMFARYPVFPALHC